MRFNYVYEPNKLIASRPQISKNSFVQTYILTVDNMEYTFTISIQSGKVFFASRADVMSEDFDVTLHNNEEHIYKLIHTLNLIIERYVKQPSTYSTMGDFIIKSIEFSPAVNIATHAIEIGKRNRMYEDMINAYIFNQAVDYEIGYNGNNLVFNNPIMKKEEEKMRITNL